MANSGLRMLSTDDYDSLPDDPHLGFAILIDLLNTSLDDNDRGDGPSTQLARTYAETVVAYIDEHDLADEFTRIDRNIPYSQDDFWVWWREFRGALSYQQARIRLRYRKGGGLTVVLSADHRKEIHELLNKVRIVVGKLDVHQEKRDAILSRLNRLAVEVDKSRTSMEAFFAATLATAGTAGQAAEKLKPVVDLLERIKKVFFDAKAQDLPPQLPAPEERKQIEGPKGTAPERRAPKPQDDDIPF